jgi:hypothetical protein
MTHKKSLAEKYLPSQPYSCVICLNYCLRPGWWTVEEAAKAIQAGYARRMMLEEKLCELHGTGFLPLECRYCHHDRQGLGVKCHADLEKDWNTPAGRSLVVGWSKLTGFYQRHVIARSNPRLLID